MHPDRDFRPRRAPLCEAGGTACGTPGTASRPEAEHAPDAAFEPAFKHPHRPAGDAAVEPAEPSSETLDPAGG